MYFLRLGSLFSLFLLYMHDNLGLAVLLLLSRERKFAASHALKFLHRLVVVHPLVA